MEDCVPVLHPTCEQFSDFSAFITSIYDQVKHIGICKIVPPKDSGWLPRKSGYENIELEIPTPIKQILEGARGAFQQFNLEKKTISVKNFKILADKRSQLYGIDKLDHKQIERKFWKTLNFRPPTYGADMMHSLFDEEVENWNPQKLYKHILQLIGTEIPGITAPYLYFGMWKAMFAWHTEDMDLFSINYLHYGKPKRWYAIPINESGRFETIAQSFFPEEHRKCKQFLRHKTTMVSPSMLQSKYNITIRTVVQEQGDFIVTFPGVYHCGFNHGYNIAESVNFATEHWFEFGKKAKPCRCDSDSVTIDVDHLFSKYYAQKGNNEKPTPPTRKRKSNKDAEEQFSRIKKIKLVMPALEDRRSSALEKMTPVEPNGINNVTQTNNSTSADNNKLRLLIRIPRNIFVNKKLNLQQAPLEDTQSSMQTAIDGHPYNMAQQSLPSQQTLQGPVFEKTTTPPTLV